MSLQNLWRCLMEVKLQTAAEMAACWCGRGKDGLCDGSHTFTDEEWAEQNYEWTPERFKDTPNEAWLKQPSEESMQVAGDVKEMGKCGCGRSPTGYCIGWHGLNEEQYLLAKTEYELDLFRKEAQQLWFKDGSCTGGKPE